MRILITGATGFVGGALATRLWREDHQLVAWVRSADRARARLGDKMELFESSGEDQRLDQEIDRADAVINLAGAPILPGRWTTKRKRELVDSRVQTTQRLAEGLHRAKTRPRVLVSVSAVGYYGDTGDQVVDEGSPAGSGFLASLCSRWEAAAQQAASEQTRVAILRVGVVLGQGGGMLSTLLPQFKLGLGGSLGSGRQHLPWIHLGDLTEVMAQALLDERYQGVINAVAPAPVRFKEFARALGRVLHRPAFLRMPAFLLKMVLGEAASALLMSSNVASRRLDELGFAFRFRRVEEALEEILRPDGSDGIGPSNPS
ncbi:MAG: TIGR01777 family oxidoreductase [Bradymonadales bacterium]|nr:TIGR01777 family oxidoreductase [Bradymonadales bacterium]